MTKEKNENSKQLLTETETGRVNFNVFWVDIENSNSIKNVYKQFFGKNPQEATITTPEIRKVVFSLLQIEGKRRTGMSDEDKEVIKSIRKLPEDKRAKVLEMARKLGLEVK